MNFTHTFMKNDYIISRIVTCAKDSAVIILMLSAAYTIYSYAA